MCRTRCSVRRQCVATAFARATSSVMTRTSPTATDAAVVARSSRRRGCDVMTRSGVFIRWVSVCALLHAGFAPVPALAHGIPLDLAFFGPFGTPTVRCLRVIGAAAQRCFRAVLAAERRCMDRQLAGQSCDTTE